jgi:hypothetical protein
MFIKYRTRAMLAGVTRWWAAERERERERERETNREI